MISFAGGLPAPELFPIDAIKRVSQAVLDEQGGLALQYASTEGYEPLRRWIAHRMERCGIHLTADDVQITNGSQQVLDLAGKLFLDEGDVVLCESPTYLAAISAFRVYGCRFVAVTTDDEGMLPDALEQALQTNQTAKLIYIIPDFQNPTGRTWSLGRRQEVARLAERFNVAVLEDNPYGALRFEGENLPAVKSFDEQGKVLYAGTFSKTFCPAYRIGWVAGDRALIRTFTLLKQGTDLQSNTLAQMEIARYLETYDLDAHIETIRQVYKRRRDLMMTVMDREFPDSVTFTRPQGGLFAWVTLPVTANARDILIESLKQQVAFVPGGAFFPNGGGENTFRVNFSNMPEERIVEGTVRLGRVLHRML